MQGIRQLRHLHRPTTGLVTGSMQGNVDTFFFEFTKPVLTDRHTFFELNQPKYSSHTYSQYQFYRTSYKLEVVRRWLHQEGEPPPPTHTHACTPSAYAVFWCNLVRKYLFYAMTTQAVDSAVHSAVHCNDDTCGTCAAHCVVHSAIHCGTLCGTHCGTLCSTL